MNDIIKKLEKENEIYRKKIGEQQLQLIQKNNEFNTSLDEAAIAWKNSLKYQTLEKIAKAHHKLDWVLILFGGSMIAGIMLPTLIIPYFAGIMSAAFSYGLLERHRLDKIIDEYVKQFDVFPPNVSLKECTEYALLYEKLYEELRKESHNILEEKKSLQETIKEWNYKVNTNLCEIKKGYQEEQEPRGFCTLEESDFQMDEKEVVKQKTYLMGDNKNVK